MTQRLRRLRTWSSIPDHMSLFCTPRHVTSLSHRPVCGARAMGTTAQRRLHGLHVTSYRTHDGGSFKLALPGRTDRDVRIWSLRSGCKLRALSHNVGAVPLWRQEDGDHQYLRRSGCHTSSTWTCPILSFRISLPAFSNPFDIYLEVVFSAYGRQPIAAPLVELKDPATVALPGGLRNVIRDGFHFT